MKALERLSRKSGALFDKDEVGMLDGDIIRVEDGPYIFQQVVR